MGLNKSPWIYHINTGSCNGCDIELVSLLGGRYDIEMYGGKLTGSPKHADIVLITGPVTKMSKDRMLNAINQVPKPRVILSLGACPLSCNVFKGSYSVDGPLDKWIDVDISVAGCPPKPQAILKGIKKAMELLSEKRGE